ncbi:unnamed protein product [Owenia fusiformis]|uniref:RING-type E3 ubiquitin transferase n=1 Tax=Owenia fusiformis TaxID=6347 RepID=A0A8J1Y2Z1_OWEFU|nr:unnamed protein product [Owenia fusiformis]
MSLNMGNLCSAQSGSEEEPLTPSQENLPKIPDHHKVALETLAQESINNKDVLSHTRNSVEADDLVVVNDVKPMLAETGLQCVLQRIDKVDQVKHRYQLNNNGKMETDTKHLGSSSTECNTDTLTNPIDSKIEGQTIAPVHRSKYTAEHASVLHHPSGTSAMPSTSSQTESSFIHEGIKHQVEVTMETGPEKNTIVNSIISETLMKDNEYWSSGGPSSEFMPQPSLPQNASNSNVKENKTVKEAQNNVDNMDTSGDSMDPFTHWRVAGEALRRALREYEVETTTSNNSTSSIPTLVSPGEDPMNAMLEDYNKTRDNVPSTSAINNSINALPRSVADIVNQHDLQIRKQEKRAKANKNKGSKRHSTTEQTCTPRPVSYYKDLIKRFKGEESSNSSEKPCRNECMSSTCNKRGEKVPRNVQDASSSDDELYLRKPKHQKLSTKHKPKLKKSSQNNIVSAPSMSSNGFYTSALRDNSILNGIAIPDDPKTKRMKQMAENGFYTSSLKDSAILSGISEPDNSPRHVPKLKGAKKHTTGIKSSKQPVKRSLEEREASKYNNTCECDSHDSDDEPCPQLVSSSCESGINPAVHSRTVLAQENSHCHHKVKHRKGKSAKSSTSGLSKRTSYVCGQYDNQNMSRKHSQEAYKAALDTERDALDEHKAHTEKRLTRHQCQAGFSLELPSTHTGRGKQSARRRHSESESDSIPFLDESSADQSHPPDTNESMPDLINSTSGDDSLAEQQHDPFEPNASDFEALPDLVSSDSTHYSDSGEVHFSEPEEIPGLESLDEDCESGGNEDADDEFECECSLCVQQRRLTHSMHEWETEEEEETVGAESAPSSAPSEPQSGLRYDSDDDFNPFPFLNFGDLTPLNLLLLRQETMRRDFLTTMFQNVIFQMTSVYPDLLGDQAPPPATNEDMEKLPIKEIDKSLLDKETSCSICLCAFESGEKATELPCNHIFHPLCIKAWLVKSGTCPTCRHKLTTATRERPQPDFDSWLGQL